VELTLGLGGTGGRGFLASVMLAEDEALRGLGGTGGFSSATNERNSGVENAGSNTGHDPPCSPAVRLPPSLPPPFTSCRLEPLEVGGRGAFLVGCFGMCGNSIVCRREKFFTSSPSASLPFGLPIYSIEGVST